MKHETILEHASKIKNLIEQLNAEISISYDLGIGVKLHIRSNPDGEVYRSGISAKIIHSKTLETIKSDMDQL